MRSILSKMPLKLSAPLILAAPVLVVAVALSIVAFSQGRRTADDLATQLLHEVHGRIQNRVDTFLDLPARVNQINFDAYLMGQLELDDVEQLAEYFWRQLRTFEGVSYVDVGTAKGDFVGVERMQDGTINLELKNATTEGALHTFKLDENMQRLSKKVRPKYDPRRRPWYVAAIQAGKPTWSEIYPFFSVPPRLGLTAVRPIHDADGTVRGVLACDLVLSHIDQFLRRLKVGKTGKTFIIERDGMLVASSSEYPSALQVGDQLKRVHVLELEDKAIRAAAAYLRERFGELALINDDLHSSFEWQGQRVLLQARPIRDKGGLDWVAVTLVPENDFMTQVQAGRRRSIVIGLGAVVLTLAGGVGLAFGMVRPILSLVTHVRRIGNGDLDCELDLRQTSELVRLSGEINAMTAGLRDRLELRRSLALAMEVQQALLPDAAPKIEGLDIAGHSTYCDQTGGDYYDYLDVMGLSEKTVAIAVGDVVGHGVAAAMLMATARGILRSRCGETGSLGELLTHMNEHLTHDVGEESGRFMTMLLMVIDAKHREVRWASAGHDPPIAYDRQSNRFLDFETGGIPLGVLDNTTYEERMFHEVRAGQIYFAGTDGVWETRNEANEDFGKKRVQQLIRRYAELSAAEISERLREELTRFRSGSTPDDDVTFVIVKVIESSDDMNE